MARRFIWLLLVGITEHTHIFVLIGSVQPLPYSQPIHHQHHCTHARVTKQLFVGLDQGSCDYSRREMPIGGELQLVGIALITINQRARHILMPQATINNKCHSLYVALVSSIVVVIQIYSCTKLTWMDGDIFAPPIHVLLSRGTFGRPSYQIENHHDSTNERSLKLRHRGCSQHAGARYAHSLLVPFVQTDIRR